MAGYWPSSFFVCLWSETNKHAKKELGLYYIILLYVDPLSYGTKREIPRGQYRSNLALNKGHHLEALGNKYKDLYEFIPQSLEMMPFV